MSSELRCFVKDFHVRKVLQRLRDLLKMYFKSTQNHPDSYTEYILLVVCGIGYQFPETAELGEYFFTISCIH